MQQPTLNQLHAQFLPQSEIPRITTPSNYAAHGVANDVASTVRMLRETGDNNGHKRELISIVVPCFNEEDVFPYLVERLGIAANEIELELTCAVEIILVDDGSMDSTWNCIMKVANSDSRFRGARLSRNFGHQAALSCGYSLSTGDAIVCLDADLQDPPEVIPEMIRKWREGADVVYAIRSHREGETAFKLWTAHVFYRLLRMMGADRLRENSGDFRLLSRRSLDALLQLKEQHRFIRGMVSWIGFNSVDVTYSRQARVAGITKYPLRKMIRLAMDAIISFSRVPLRLSYYAALIISLPFLGFFVFSIISAMFFGAKLEPGWLSVIAANTAFGAAILTSLAIMGEYVGRIYEECKQRPLYIIQDVVANAGGRSDRADS